MPDVRLRRIEQHITSFTLGDPAGSAGAGRTPTGLADGFEGFPLRPDRFRIHPILGILVPPFAQTDARFGDSFLGYIPETNRIFPHLRPIMIYVNAYYDDAHDFAGDVSFPMKSYRPSMPSDGWSRLNHE